MADNLFMQARRLLEAKDFGNAEELYLQIVENDPNNQLAWLECGYVTGMMASPHNLMWREVDYCLTKGLFPSMLDDGSASEDKYALVDRALIEEGRTILTELGSHYHSILISEADLEVENDDLEFLGWALSLFADLYGLGRHYRDKLRLPIVFSAIMDRVLRAYHPSNSDEVAKDVDILKSTVIPYFAGQLMGVGLQDDPEIFGTYSDEYLRMHLELRLPARKTPAFSATAGKKTRLTFRKK